MLFSTIFNYQVMYYPDHRVRYEVTLRPNKYEFLEEYARPRYGDKQGWKRFPASGGNDVYKI